MGSKKIKISCKVDSLLPIEDLNNFQGDLKTIEPEAFEKLKNSILKYGFSFPIFVWNDNILDGHQRLKAAKALMENGYYFEGDALPVVWIEAKNEKEAAEKLLLINSRYAKIDQSGFDLFVENFDLDIADLSDMLDIPEVDFDQNLNESGNTADDNNGETTKLTVRFIIPPFTIFDTRQGYWQDRKRAWIGLGIDSELGRGDKVNAPGGSLMPASDYTKSGKRGDSKGKCFEPGIGAAYGRKEITGTSIFDPVLCEVIYTWFCPKNGRVIDPFAGGSVRGITAGYLGLNYFGIDLREEQIVANKVQFKEIFSSRKIKIKISAKSARQKFKCCEPGYIKSNCHASCCQSSTEKSGIKVAVRDFEKDNITRMGGVVDKGYLKAVNKKCPFKNDEHLCSLHNTGHKPFGCIASPFILNSNNTLVIRNRYRLLKCYKDGGNIPAYKNFKPSLELILGKANADNLCEHLDNGGGDITLEIDYNIYEKLKCINSNGIVKWIEGDSRNIDNLYDNLPADLLFSCPPYVDLEVYSNNEKDLSSMEYPDFISAYNEIIGKCYNLLQDDSFACFVVGEVRDKKGNYYNFVGETIAAFLTAGFKYYNEAILINSLNTLPLRAPRAFEASRKLGKAHQNVLVFIKGDARVATNKLEKIDLNSIFDFDGGDTGGD